MTGKHWLIAVIIIVNGCFVYTGLHNLIMKKRQWKDQDITVLVNTCIEDAGDNGIKYPNATRAYCECSFNKIRIKLNRKEYVDIISKPISEQKRLLIPIFQDCLTEYQKEIKQ